MMCPLTPTLSPMGSRAKHIWKKVYLKNPAFYVHEEQQPISRLHIGSSFKGRLTEELHTSNLGAGGSNPFERANDSVTCVINLISRDGSSYQLATAEPE